MANGCCIVATNISSHKEIIDDGVNGFLYEDISNAEEIIEKIMLDVEIFNKISSNNYSTIKQKYLLEIIIEKEIELYQKLVKN